MRTKEPIQTSVLLAGRTVKSIIGEYVMAQDKESKNKYDKEDMDVWLQSQKNWRAWGSWFSWGSPIGLGIFFVLVAATVWILVQTFK